MTNTMLEKEFVNVSRSILELVEQEEQVAQVKSPIRSPRDLNGLSQLRRDHQLLSEELPQSVVVLVIQQRDHTATQTICAMRRGKYQSE